MSATTPIEQLGSLTPSLKGQTLQSSRKSADESGVAATNGENRSIANVFEDSVTIASPIANDDSRQSQAASRQQPTQSAQADVREQIVERVQQIVEEAQKRATSVQFQIDEDSGQVIVKVISRESGDVIRQIPPDELLHLQGQMQQMKGILFREVS